MTWCDPAPALCLWLTHVSHTIRAQPPRSEQSLASVHYAPHARGVVLPSLLRLEDILIGCFRHWTSRGTDPRWGLWALQRVSRGLAVSAPAHHEALGYRYGTAAALRWSPSPLLERGHAVL